MLLGYTWIRPGLRQCGLDPERMICDDGRVWCLHNDEVDQGGGSRIEAIRDIKHNAGGLRYRDSRTTSGVN